MSKHKIRLVIISVIVIIAALICTFFLLFSDSGGEKYAYIYSNGELLYRINLNDSNKEFTIKTDNGCNTVCLRDGKIGITEADCPDKTCIKTGFTDNSFIPVICMPHRLEIVIKSEAIETDGVSR